VGERRVVLAFVFAASLGLAPAAVSTSATRLAGFQPASGWLVVRAGRDNPSLVVAVTAQDAAAVRPVSLFGSFKKLSRGGILIWVDTAGQRRKGFPIAATWPPQLKSFRVDRGWEGQPAPNVQQRVWLRLVHGWDLDIRVFFATQRPGSALQARAQAELNRLRLP
jgi:hypothetical protein